MLNKCPFIHTFLQIFIKGLLDAKHTKIQFLFLMSLHFFLPNSFCVPWLKVEGKDKYEGAVHDAEKARKCAVYEADGGLT